MSFDTIYEEAIKRESTSELGDAGKKRKIKQTFTRGKARDPQTETEKFVKKLFDKLIS